jgi:hypothetical protein
MFGQGSGRGLQFQTLSAFGIRKKQVACIVNQDADFCPVRLTQPDFSHSPPPCWVQFDISKASRIISASAHPMVQENETPSLNNPKRHGLHGFSLNIYFEICEIRGVFHFRNNAAFKS